jgi:hypothetical protein
MLTWQEEEQNNRDEERGKRNKKGDHEIPKRRKPEIGRQAWLATFVFRLFVLLGLS